ncbi:MAG: hypothetical protein MHM6MM_005927, partial [Cercozoa sp. M6MM]
MSATELIPVTLRRALGDRTYEKRKTAAVQLERSIKVLLNKGQDDAVLATIDVLREDFVESADPNMRKGGLIGLSAAAIAIGHDKLPDFLDAVAAPALVLISDEDPRVRYNACEAMYNITKVAQSGILAIFNEVLAAVCDACGDVDDEVKNGAQLLDRLVKDVVMAAPDIDVNSLVGLLRERLRVRSPFVRSLVLGWLAVL